MFLRRKRSTSLSIRQSAQKSLQGLDLKIHLDTTSLAKPTVVSEESDKNILYVSEDGAENIGNFSYGYNCDSAHWSDYTQNLQRGCLDTPDMMLRSVCLSMLAESPENDLLANQDVSVHEDILLQHGWTPITFLVSVGNVNLIRDLLFIQRDVNTFNSFHLNPLMCCAWLEYPMQEYWDLPSLLLNQGASVDSASPVDGWTALMYATVYCNKNLVRLLINANVSIDQRNHKGQTALMLAASVGCRVLLSFFLRAGADVTLKDNAGHGVFAYANAYVSSILKLHIKQSIALARLPDRDARRALSKAYCNHALMIPLRKLFQQDFHFVKLVAQKKHMDFSSSGHYDEDAYDSITQYFISQDIRFAKNLLNAGARLNYQKESVDRGNTALMVAVERGDDMLVFFLLRYGAIINAQNNLGQTALHIAIEKEHIKILELLLWCCPNLILKDSHGQDAMQLALTKKNDSDIFSVLQNFLDVHKSLLRSDFNDKIRMIKIIHSNKI
ncbi:MAG: ankyrin repeat domain-containing protein [Pseudomonadota bacterium]|nr:ankyrin repeat domain-containing protein [Pseudomonadota bacterium]